MQGNEMYKVITIELNNKITPTLLQYITILNNNKIIKRNTL